MKLKFIIIVLCLSTLQARNVVVKMATLAPEGTDWHGMLIEMGQEWQKATKGKVKLRIYPGGVLGDERKADIGSLSNNAAYSYKYVSK